MDTNNYIWIFTYLTLSTSQCPKNLGAASFHQIIDFYLTKDISNNQKQFFPNKSLLLPCKLLIFNLDEMFQEVMKYYSVKEK